MNPIVSQGEPQFRRSRDKVSRVADVLVAELVKAGVEVVFGIPGGSISPVYDALLDHPEIRHVMNRHECNAVFAAAGYAQTTGKLGVVLVTSGPGVLNTMNGIGSAFTDGLPVLVLAGEASRERFGHGAVQEGSYLGLNVVGMASHITKLSLEVPEPGAALPMVRRAMATALSGKRGPVFMSLPLNILGAPVSECRASVSVDTEFVIDYRAVVDAKKALRAPGKKIILAGAGTRQQPIPTLLRQLAERLQCPVVTTPKGKGVFPEDHPLHLGIFGMGGHRSSSEYLKDGADTVLVLGSSLGEVATDGWSPLLKARRCFIHVDIDSLSIGRTYTTDLAVAAPANVFLEVLLQDLPQSEEPQPYGITYDRDPASMDQDTGQGLPAPRAIWELQQVLPADTIYTTDSGSNLFFALHYLKITQPDSFISLLGLGSMGTAISTAIGAQMAHPQRTVVALVGDGGLAMSAGELSTAASLGLPIIVVVLNDGRYSMAEYGQLMTYKRPASYPALPMDLDKLAESVEAHYSVARSPQSILLSMLEKKKDRLHLIDVRLDANVGIPTNKRFESVAHVLN